MRNKVIPVFQQVITISNADVALGILKCPFFWWFVPVSLKKQKQMEHGSANAAYYEVASFFFSLTEKDSAQANEKKSHKKQAKTSQEVSKLD